MINQNLLLGDEGYNIQRSLRFRSSASAYLSRTPASAGSTTKGTFSFWIKRGLLSTAQQIYHVAGTSGNNSRFYLAYTATTDAFTIVGYDSAGTIALQLVTTQVFRDPSAWYHIVISLDTTQPSSSNRAVLFINGVQVSAFGTSTIPAQNTALGFTNNTASLIGANQGATNYFDGYLTEINFIDGQALTPAYFGFTDPATGTWQPLRYGGTYGTNGFYLNFSDNSNNTATTIGKDYSGNGNNWTPNNISVTSGATYDSMTDVPTLTSATAANYSVVNPLNKQSDISATNGNLTISLGSVSSTVRKINASIGLPSTGKYYWESTNTGTSAANMFLGIQSPTASLTAIGTNDIFYNEAGEIQNNGSTTSGYATLTTNDIVGVAYDADNNKIYFYKNNVLQNSGGTTPSFSSPYIPFFGMFASNNGQQINFGQRPFAYTPPTGFVALNTFNLPTPTIGATSSSLANKYFDATLYTGTGATQSIVNAGGFQPDLVWGKCRSAGSTSNWLEDSVRGAGLVLYSDQTTAESNNSTYLPSINSNGFTVAGNTPYFNSSGQTFVGWQWRASNATGVTNTAGSITSTVSANTTAGFSIVTYTGNGGSSATVGHGLGVAPKMIIVKRRDAAFGWNVYHASIGAGNVLFMQTTDAQASSTVWNSTTPTSSVFSLGTSSGANANLGTYVAYCFAEVAGYSKFGSYTGNGSTDGTFVFTGFRPRFVMRKRTDSATDGAWALHDSVRNQSNVIGAYLFANLSDAEGSAELIDFTSNGFKFRSASGNASGGTFIYMAFAEFPFRYSLAR